ncbi:MAG TPA: agmatine deiminase family protein [Puia sp.]|jgi:agmatine deiminase|nr:agmatine deiminase family protein [Puia sp.]
MIPDYKTNLLCLSDILPKNYPNFYQQFEKVLKDCGINFKLLSPTNDIWAVDYMPVQIDINKFVQFVYKPSYLKTRAELNTISNVDAICKQLGIETIRLNILLDGGNVIRATDKIIMTERIFYENSTYKRENLMKELQNYFEVEKIFIIPEQPNDFTGHADGMVRFIDDKTVLINNYKSEGKKFRDSFEITIRKTGLNYIKIPYNPYNNDDEDQANGCYINYLQMENVVIIPTFGIKEDDVVVKQFEEIFKGQTIATINCHDIAKNGGVLNCITWNIRAEK